MTEIVNLYNYIINTYGIWWIVGQAFGIIATVFGFISFQMRTPKSILIIQCCVSGAFVFHYLLIGAYVGMAMNFVCIIRNLVYDRTNTAGKGGRIALIVFVALQFTLGLVFWENWYSIFPLLGSIAATCALSMRNPQNVRRGILIAAPLVFAYDILTIAIGGIIYEPVAMASALIGLIRNRKKATDAADAS